MQKFKILFVDDDEDLLNLSKVFIQDNNCQLIVKQDALEALKILHAEKIDLIISDLQMYPISGFQLIRKLKSNSSFQNIPIIVLSANNDIESINKAIELGADDYLIKPFNPFIFQKKIRKILYKKFKKIYRFPSVEESISLSVICRVHSVSNNSIKIESKINFNTSSSLKLNVYEPKSQTRESLIFLTVNNQPNNRKEFLINELVPVKINEDFYNLKKGILSKNEK